MREIAATHPGRHYVQTLHSTIYSTISSRAKHLVVS